MDVEREKTIEAVKLSLQMEIEGKQYYEEAAEKSTNSSGKWLFEWLAGEEDKHRNRFEQIYDAIRNRKAWPKIKFEPGSNTRAKDAFLEAVRAIGMQIKNTENELDIIDRAMQLEDKTYKYYRERNASTMHKAEKSFYESIAAEERGHYLALVGYREYIIDPSGFFTKEERHGLDGA